MSYLLFVYVKTIGPCCFNVYVLNFFFFFPTREELTKNPEKETWNFCAALHQFLNIFISHQLFEYTITYIISQHENTNSKGDFVLKKTVLNVRFKDFYTKINQTQIWYEKLN